MRKSALLSLLSGAFGESQSLASRAISQNCTGSFTHISAAAAFAALDPGWNLANTLDAIPDEGTWNNARVQATTFSQIKAEGFKNIKILGNDMLYIPYLHSSDKI
jgi:endoglucanase